MSCINRKIGFDWVDEEFSRIQNRPKWAIPWLEDDGAMVLPQLWTGRMRRDAADARSYGCSGLIGIHWRTKILAPNLSALAQSAWSPRGWNSATERTPLSKRKRDLACADFYADMSAAWFGPEVAADVADFFARHDGSGGADRALQGQAVLPRPATWLYGPGAIVASREPWSEASKHYAFVDELAALRPRVRGAGNLARFDYWLNTFRYMRALAEVACARGTLDVALEHVGAEKDAARKKTQSQSEALPARIHLARAWETMMMHLRAATDTSGELGTIANLEQSTRGARKFVEGRDQELVDLLGEPLPEIARVSTRYQGEPRIIVPTLRSVVVQGETLTLKVIVLDNAPPTEARLFWRQLGAGEFRDVPLRHVGRGVYEVKLPLVPVEGAEYYIRARTVAGKELVWPATAPIMNHTLVEMIGP
jgi:hypothetical protein